MRSVIIGLCGRAGSGKSSAARFLREQFGAQIISFAGPLKQMAMDIWGFTEEQVFGEAEIKETSDPRWGITPRWALQKLGGAARKHLSEDIWVHHALSQVEHGIYVIEDVRYLNEAHALFNCIGGYVIRLQCTDYTIPRHLQNHPSEVEVDLIPEEHVYAEIQSSRAQGLDHLLSLVNIAVVGILQENNAVKVNTSRSTHDGKIGFTLGDDSEEGVLVELDGKEFRVDKKHLVYFNQIITLIECGPSQCEHVWDGPDIELDGGYVISSTCSKCGMDAFSYSLWVGP